MPKAQGQSPTTISQNKETLLTTIPAGICNGQLFIKFLGSGTLYFKWACTDNEHCDNANYEDSLGTNEWRIVDSPDDGRVLVFCSSADSSPNLVWHASWEFST